MLHRATKQKKENKRSIIMGTEIRMDDVIAALSSEKPEETFINDPGLYWGLIYYCLRDSKSLIARIKEEYDIKNHNCLYGLIKFFPVTSDIIEQLVFDEDILSDVIDKIECAEIMERCFNSFTNAIDSDSKIKSDKINDISISIGQYKEEIRRKQEEIDKYKENMKAEKELHDILIEKENELRELEAEWGKEIINEKIQKAEDAINKKKAEKEKAEKKLKELCEKLNQVENCNDKDFLEIIKTLNDIIKELPKDVSES
jgi:hypothetical protein